jgi:hypothetical protein
VQFVRAMNATRKSATCERRETKTLSRGADVK